MWLRVIVLKSKGGRPQVFMAKGPYITKCGYIAWQIKAGDSTRVGK